MPDKDYVTRDDKAGFVYKKYKALLGGSVLDVGADAMFLKKHVTRGGGQYVGVGLGEGIDHELDLEKSPLPFDDDQFDTVLCLDVLEHLESIHFMFSELSRCARTNIIIALPNPWSDFFVGILFDRFQTSPMKFYGLPIEPPRDRHRWFFGLKDAKEFLKYSAKKYGYNITQIEVENENKPMGGKGIKGILGRWLLKQIFRADIDQLGLTHGTLWCVLEKDIER